jgi:hypothetical protein
MTAYVFLLLLMTTTLILGVGLLFLSRLKRMAEDSRIVLTDEGSSDDERKFLAENWKLVEKTALEHGMSADELARVRRNVFGAG